MNTPQDDNCESMIIYGFRGEEIFVDTADYPWLNNFSWSIKGGYASTTIQGKGLLMHKLIILAPPGLEVDHINRVRHDNRRCNLRLATPSQNCINWVRKHGVNPYRGVRLYRKKWRVSIKTNSEIKAIGTLEDCALAAHVYDAAATRYHGEFAILNFPDEPLWPEAIALLDKYEQNVAFHWIGIRFYGKRWNAALSDNGTKVNIGTYDTREEAARAYDRYIIEHGLTRRTNFPR